MTNKTCSCGCENAHVLCTRKTWDGVKVHLWSDCTITSDAGTGTVGFSADEVEGRQLLNAACILTYVEFFKLVNDLMMPHTKAD